MSIEGKVAAILNNRELLINKGSDDGVQTQMRFMVMDRGLDVQDPDTYENLGHFARQKIRVEIIEVQPKFSVARTYETYTVNLLPETSFAAFLRPSYATRVRTIRTKDDFLFEEGSSMVTVGDPVTQFLQAKSASEKPDAN